MKASKPIGADPGESQASAGGNLFPIAAIGASAGGLEAFTQLLSHLPPDTGMAFVLIQHLDPEHESALTQILSRATSLPVVEITTGLLVEPDHVYVIPPNADLTVERRVLRLEPRPTGRTPHRPIDTFFDSLAADQRERAIGIVLSGTASDGTLGLESIKAEGGITFAQDDTARHDSMPRSAVAAGCVDLVLPPAEIARELARIAKHPYVAGDGLTVSTAAEASHAESVAHQGDATPLPSGGTGTPSTGGTSARFEATRGRSGREAPKIEGGYRQIMSILNAHCGVDFTLYKSSTIRRRIHRRMVLTKQDTLEGYARFLRGNAPELDSLFSDVLISVTSFFRNPEAFEALQRKILPRLLAQPGDDPIRCWVLGCSTGQEAYSVAIAFIESAERAHSPRRVQVFATDLNDRLLEKARHGLYAKSLAQDISAARLNRYFVEEEGGYRVSKSIREMVVFARQNLIADPPFSRMDLITCRNLLIYLEPSLQKRALPTFHYALKPGGFLVLGSSESVGEFTQLFETVDQKHRIFSRKAAPTPPFHLPAHADPAQRASATGGHVWRQTDSPPPGARSELGAQREADRVAISQFAPPGVLINDDLQVLQFRGPTGAYLEPPAGKASFDVVKMARDGLTIPLRAAIQEAKKENKPSRAKNVRVTRDGVTRAIHVDVIPLHNLAERYFLVAFVDHADGVLDSATRPVEPLREDQQSRRIGELEAELAATREYLQSVQEQHEGANEELQGANEEVQSANEELQSINEELETSKEELESTNEELITVNEEMSQRNLELSRLNNDLINLQASAKLGIVLLARDLTIRRFSQIAERQFHLLAADVGRPVGHVRHGLTAASAAGDRSPVDMEALGADIIASTQEQEQEVQDSAGRWYSLRARPYVANDGRVDGVVLVLMDIDTLKRSKLEVMHQEEQLRETHATLQAHAEELTRFNNIAVGRELRMIELKQEINALCRQAGEAERYPLEFAREGGTTDA